MRTLPETQSFCRKPFGDAGSFSAPSPASGAKTSIENPPAAEKSYFPDSCHRKSFPTTGQNPIFPIPAVENHLLLRVKMTELYFLPYKAAEIYGTGNEISCFGRSEIPISAGQHAILLISAVEARRRSNPRLFPPLHSPSFTW